MRNSAVKPEIESVEFDYSDCDFEKISKIAYDSFGLSLQESKKQLVYSRLSKRLRQLKIERFSDYVDLLISGRDNFELDHMLSALTTNVTKFFRESHHFGHFCDSVLPGLVQGALEGRRVRIWSAGCSTGQEPYSIALCALKQCPEIERFNFKILATDIDRNVLSIAAAGTYPFRSKSAIPNHFIDEKGYMSSDIDGDRFEFGGRVKKLITFARLNLVDQWPMRGEFDAIWCRNVVIYFDKDTQSVLWEKMAKRMATGGSLFIGHSERISGPAERLFEPVSGVPTAFRRL